jgi:hypothetical protein
MSMTWPSLIECLATDSRSSRAKGALVKKDVMQRLMLLLLVTWFHYGLSFMVNCVAVVHETTMQSVNFAMLEELLSL